MLKTILSAACASALLAGAAFAQSASSPTQDSTIKDPARMEKPPASHMDGAKTQPYPSRSGTPSGFDKSEQKAMDDKAMSRDRKMSRTQRGTTAGASSSIAPQCSGLATEQEVTRCLNRHMAELAERGQSPTR